MSDQIEHPCGDEKTHGCWVRAAPSEKGVKEQVSGYEFTSLENDTGTTASVAETSCEHMVGGGMPTWDLLVSMHISIA